MLAPISVSACLISLAAAQQDSRFVEHRLSADLAVRGAGISERYTPSPSGSQVAFIRHDSPALYVSAVDGSSIETLLDARGGGGVIWTPDSTRIVYSNGPIHSVLADGSGVPVELAPSGIPLAITSSGALLLFTGSFTGPLHAVPVDGSGPAYILTTSSADYVLAASGSWVVYEDQDRLYSVPVDGGTAPLQISTPGGTSVELFELAHTGDRAVYRADFKLWSAPLDASTPALQITPTMIWSREIFGFHVTPDGNQVVYISDLTNNQIHELYSVPIDGSASPLRLTPLASGNVLDFLLSPDGATALYVDEAGSLFSVATDGSAPPLDLDRTLPSLATWQTLTCTPDSSTLLFQDGGLFAGPLDGSAPIERVDISLHAHGTVRSFAITPDSAHVLFLSDDVLDERFELFRLELASGEQARLSGPLLGHADVADFRLDAVGEQVFWRADSRVIGQTELFARAVQGGPPPALLSTSGTPLTVGRIGSVDVSHGRVFFLADVTTASEKELFVAPDDGRAPARRLSPLAHGTVLSFLVDPGGRTVVFLSEANAEGRGELFRVPVDGSSPAMRLHAALEDGMEVRDYSLSPDGEYVVFTIHVKEQEFELFSAPLADGPSVLLQRFSSGWPSFVFTPDSSAVVHIYGGNPLSVSPVDGSAPVRVLVEGGLFLSDIEASATRVVYRDHGRLFSVPLAGGTPLELNDPLPVGGVVLEHELTPDGAWVVYRADAVTLGRFLLLRVATDRSSPPLVLNGPMAAGSDVTRFQLTKNSTHAIYHVELNTYAVPVVGGPPLRIGGYDNEFLPPAGDFVVIGGSVVPLDGSPPTPLPPYELLGFWSDGKKLLMRQPTTRQFLSVSLDGRRKILLTPPLNAYTYGFRIAGEGVVYLDTRAAPSISELYSSQPRKAAKVP